jgi:hypothetical protein
LNWVLEFRVYKQKLFKVKQDLINTFSFDPSFLFFLAMLKITPILVLKPITMGSVVYEMPFPLNY